MKNSRDLKTRLSQAAIRHSANQLEVISKPQIRFKGKASRELETERTREYVSISIRGTTQPLGLRWGFETTSKLNITREEESCE